MIQPGTFLIHRYEVLAKIGSGGMADVYKALDHRLNRNVAIKVLKAEFSKDQTFVSKFRAEAQAAAGMTHANIVNVYDVSEENGRYFIVMELVEGITLKEFILAKGKLSVRETVGIAIQIAQGLEVA
ncbi:MAG: serine/threonine protein kinase, partial [Lachnospiraceae bacterium]|nr:serine/threonine protein kinase [Lachnospiraceae bacterium]